MNIHKRFDRLEAGQDCAPVILPPRPECGHALIALIQCVDLAEGGTEAWGGELQDQEVVCLVAHTQGPPERLGRHLLALAPVVEGSNENVYRLLSVEVAQGVQNVALEKRVLCS